MNAMKADMKVTFYKAGKADAILIKSQGHAALIDAGLEKNAGSLSRKMKTRLLDALIVTHYDKDHIGGAGHILERMEVDNVYVTFPDRQHPEPLDFNKACQRKKILPQIVDKDFSFTLGGALLEIYAAKESYTEFPSNNSSLIVRATCCGARFLFLADAQSARIREFIDGHDVACDVLKVPYHGHMQEEFPRLAQLSQARHAVITNGDNEPSRREIEQTAALLMDYGMLVHETRRGNVTVLVRDGQIIIKH